VVNVVVYYVSPHDWMHVAGSVGSSDCVHRVLHVSPRPSCLQWLGHGYWLVRPNEIEIGIVIEIWMESEIHLEHVHPLHPVSEIHDEMERRYDHDFYCDFDSHFDCGSFHACLQSHVLLSLQLDVANVSHLYCGFGFGFDCGLNFCFLLLLVLCLVHSHSPVMHFDHVHD